MTIQKDHPEIRVLHIIGRLLSGGVELRTLDLISNTESDHFSHHVCLTSGLTGTLDREYSKNGASLHYLKLHSPKFWIQFIKLIRSESIEVVHSNIHYSSGLIMFLSWLAGAKVRITHFRSDGDKITSGLLKRLRISILKTFINLFATKIVGLTPMNLSLAWSNDWKKDSRCAVVPNGVKIHSSIDTQVSPQIKKFSEKTVLLHAGRANLPTKNREKAITVFAKYASNNQNSVLIFVGRDGNDHQQSTAQLDSWRKLAQDLQVEDKIFFLGDQKNMSEFYYGADMFLFTSTKEGLPGVVLEALSHGLPVVSSNVPGAVFISESCRKISILDPDASDHFWSTALENCSPKLTKPERISNMKNFALSDFTIDNAIENYSALWST